MEKRENTRGSYYLILESELLPFVASKFNLKTLEQANSVLQKFVGIIEKKFDAIWYIGTDIFEDEVFERFMFHHGGFMEISLKGRVRCYFEEDKIDKLKKAIYIATLKLSNKGSAAHLMEKAKSGQKLISMKDSIALIEVKKGDKK